MKTAVRFARYAGVQLRLLGRDRQLLFWNVGFFVLLLVLFLGPLSGGDASVRVTLAAGLVTTQIMANALFSVGVGLSSARARGVFRRYAITPAPRGLVVGGSIAARVALVSGAAVLQVLIARVMFNVPWTGGLLTILAIIVAGSCVFAGIGFLIAALARAPHVANTATNLVFIPMLALGGTALPASMMPEAWARVHWVLPTAAVFNGLLGAFVGGQTVIDQLSPLAYLVAWAGVTGVAGTYFWNRREA
ncbi:MAG: ABC transporter permease [Vicinamibacterales bacterium]